MTVSKLAAAFIEGSKQHQGGPNGTITRIVIHGTVSGAVKGGARNTAAYFQSAGSGGLAHYVVDPGEIIGCCSEDVWCWHAPPNPGSIGVELCDPQAGPGSRWADSAHVAEESLAAKLVADLCSRYKIPIVKLSVADLLAGKHGICGHVDVAQAWHQSDHVDPGPDFPWSDFINRVNGAAAVPRWHTQTIARDTLNSLSTWLYGNTGHADRLWLLNPGLHDDSGQRVPRDQVNRYLPAGQTFTYERAQEAHR